MRTITIYRAAVPDGDPCDECPRTLGRGGRMVRITDDGRTRVEQVCSHDVTRLRRSADHVEVERR